MDERRTTPERQALPTDVLKETPKAGDKNEHTDYNLYTVEGKSQRTVNERTLKKRLSKFASSRTVLLLAIFTSLSAVLTAFRGYLLPVTLFLAVLRTCYAVGLWLVYTSKGKKGGGFLAAFSLVSTAAAVIGLLLLAAFIGCGMFGKLLLVRTDGTVRLAKAILEAKTFAVVPALICIMAAYCVYLFKKYERQTLCNMRDGLRFGFPFGQGSLIYARNCLFVSGVLLAVTVARSFFVSFSGVGFIPGYAVEALDWLLIPHCNFAAFAAGAVVQVAVYVLSAVLAFRYGGIVKRYKAQKAAADEARRSAEDGASAVLEAEREKAAGRAGKRKTNEKE